MPIAADGFRCVACQLPIVRVGMQVSVNKVFDMRAKKYVHKVTCHQHVISYSRDRLLSLVHADCAEYYVEYIKGQIDQYGD